MENAGAGAARRLRALTRERPNDFAEPFRIVCGPGNNGGDGFVVGRYLHNYGFEVHLYLCANPSYPAESESNIQLEIIRRMRLPLTVLEPGAIGETIHPGLSGHHEFPRGRKPSRGTQIDALFGTGLSRPIRAPYSEAIAALNASDGPTIALDVPSGLDADTGAVHGVAVEARETITFAAPKIGFGHGDGPRLCGHVHVVDIGLPREIWDVPRSSADDPELQSPAE